MIAGGASDNLIGTSGHSADDAGQRNVISGNLNDGIDIYGHGTSGNVVAGNFIGTNAAETAGLGNASRRRLPGGADRDQLGRSQCGLRRRRRRSGQRHLGQLRGR